MSIFYTFSMLTNISNYLQNKFLARTRNKLMMNWSSESLMIQERRKREEIRISENRPHKVFYYHQIIKLLNANVFLQKKKMGMNLLF